ncbi:MAG: 30S ribosomal protein S7 [Mycoplasmataceae bacterium]|jgi:small subunit ribosomal protein S7|nr:30S ribosomal protein S7 [Mycoplasmataceae bacterium]
MRKNQAEKRVILNDPIYNSQTIAKLINMIMWEGKKGLAQTIVYTALDKAAAKLKLGALEVFNRAISNIGPNVELKAVRVAGSNYQVPTEVNPERRTTLALRWLVEYSRNRNEKKQIDRLANEIVDAYNGTGASIKKKEDTHKNAEANKVYTNLRF